MSDKLGNELDKFVDDIQEIEGVKTIQELTVCINCEFFSFQIRFGICRGEVGFFFEECQKVKYNGGEFLMSEYMEIGGITKTLELVRKFVVELEKVEDLSEYDKPLKDLLFGVKEE